MEKKNQKWRKNFLKILNKKKFLKNGKKLKKLKKKLKMEKKSTIAYHSSESLIYRVLLGNENYVKLTLGLFIHFKSPSSCPTVGNAQLSWMFHHFSRLSTVCLGGGFFVSILHRRHQEFFSGCMWSGMVVYSGLYRHWRYFAYSRGLLARKSRRSASACGSLKSRMLRKELGGSMAV